MPNRRPSTGQHYGLFFGNWGRLFVPQKLFANHTISLRSSARFCTKLNQPSKLTVHPRTQDSPVFSQLHPWGLVTSHDSATRSLSKPTSSHNHTHTSTPLVSSLPRELASAVANPTRLANSNTPTEQFSLLMDSNFDDESALPLHTPTHP